MNKKKFHTQIRGEINHICKNTSDKPYKQKHQRNLGGGGGGGGSGGTITVCNNLVHKTKFKTKSQENGTMVQAGTDWGWQLQTAKMSQMGEEIGLHSRLLVFFKLRKKMFRVFFFPTKIARESHAFKQQSYAFIIL